MKKFLIVILIVIVLWFAWAQVGRDVKWTTSEPEIESTEQIQLDSACTKNIVAIQPYMYGIDYLNHKHHYEKLKSYFEKAKLSGYFKENTVVVLPEYIGTWLVINHEKTAVAQASSTNNAMAIIIASDTFRFLLSLLNGQGEKDKVAAAIFRMKAESMATLYGSIYKELAIEYNVTISAGSIVLPGPSIIHNTIHVNAKKPLYNTSFIFTPDGRIKNEIVKKSFPISSELPFVTPYPIEELPSYDLSIGKTAVLVCADSWYPESYNKLNELNPEVVLVGSYCSTDNAMSTLWRGYDGGVQPGDVDSNDIQKLTEYEAWVKYALPGRLKNTNAKVGVNIFLRGKLWNLGNDGYPLIVLKGNLMEVKKTERAGIYNICF